MISKIIKNPRKAAIGLAVIILLAISLAFVSNGFENAKGWLPFFLILGFCAALLLLAWKSIKGVSPPKWLWALLLGAALLRLGLGVFWLEALPAWGYDTPVQQAGYVMEDAYNRDRAAWDLAQSDLPLVESFQGYSSRDQYGGLLMLSAGVYRYSGANTHFPLLMISLAATFSAIALLYVWAFAKGLWGQKVAAIAAWGLALYPEAALLGSSQMREAFSLTLTMFALYALWNYRQASTVKNGIFLAIPMLLALSLPTPVSITLLVIHCLLALPL